MSQGFHGKSGGPGRRKLPQGGSGTAKPRSDGFVARPPDYLVSALCKQTDVKGNIGGAWINEDGTIRIRLNPFVVLDTYRQDLVVTLFPNDRDKPAQRGPLDDDDHGESQRANSEDIPF